MSLQEVYKKEKQIALEFKPEFMSEKDIRRIYCKEVIGESCNYCELTLTDNNNGLIQTERYYDYGSAITVAIEFADKHYCTILSEDNTVYLPFDELNVRKEGA